MVWALNVLLFIFRGRSREHATHSLHTLLSGYAFASSPAYISSSQLFLLSLADASAQWAASFPYEHDFADGFEEIREANLIEEFYQIAREEDTSIRLPVNDRR